MLIASSRKGVALLRPIPDLGYKWVVASNVLDLDSPQFWHSHFIEGYHFEDDEETTLGTRIVREYAGRVVIVDSFPVLHTDSPQWHFYGWVLPAHNGTPQGYNEIQLAVEVLVNSEPHILYKVYDLDRLTIPKALIEEGFSDRDENEYAFLVLVEGHSRATLLKHLCSQLTADISGFNVERIREDNESLSIFGSSSSGNWNLVTRIHRLKGTYETTFKLWRTGVNKIDRNNPSIMSEEEQYYSGESSKKEMLALSIEHLAESLKNYV